jgi:hypothetical protein
MASRVWSVNSNRTDLPALPDRSAVHRITTRRRIVDANGDNATAAQFAVDRQVEQGEVPLMPLDLQLRPDRPDMAGPQRRLGTDKLALVPRRATRRPIGNRCLIVFHVPA